MSGSMNRRDFLKSAGAVSVAALLVTQSGLPAKALSGQAQFATYPSVTGDKKRSSINISPHVLAVAGAGPLVLAFLSSFASGTLASVVSNQINDWLADLSNTNRTIVWETNKMMENEDYTDYRWSSVNKKSKSFFYPVVHEDGQNACVPVYTKNFWGSFRQIVLLEAPAIIALGAAAKQWHSNRVSPADGLVPISHIQGISPKIKESMGKPFKFGTRAGEVEIKYKQKSGQRVGDLSVVSKNGRDVLFSESYDVRWG